MLHYLAKLGLASVISAHLAIAKVPAPQGRVQRSPELELLVVGRKGVQDCGLLGVRLAAFFHGALEWVKRGREQGGRHQATARIQVARG